MLERQSQQMVLGKLTSSIHSLSRVELFVTP